MTANDSATAQAARPAHRPPRVRELVFCASTSRCNTARIVEKGTVFFCKEHHEEEAAFLEAGIDHSIVPGVAVIAKDRRNRGVVLAVDGTSATVRFSSGPQARSVDVEMSLAWLEKA